MLETLVQGRWRYSHHGFRRIKICSFPRLGSSFLSRRISFRISGCHCFVRRTSGPLLRGISASGPPVLSNRRHQYRVRVDTPKASATALIPCFSQKCSAFILNLAISGNRVFHRIDGCTIIPKIPDADMLHQHSNHPLLILRQLQYLCELTQLCLTFI